MYAQSEAGVNADVPNNIVGFYNSSDRRLCGYANNICSSIERRMKTKSSQFEMIEWWLLCFMLRNAFDFFFSLLTADNGLEAIFFAHSNAIFLKINSDAQHMTHFIE